MVQTVSLSTRVTPQVRDRLAAEASARGVPLATHTRALLSAPPRPEGGEDELPDPVQNEVRCLFTDMPAGAGLAREAGEAGGTAPCVLNAVDEVAVAAFLYRRLRFTGISEVVERML